MIVAQISDTHIARPGSAIDRRYDTSAHLQRAVAHLLRLPKVPDAVVVTGDVVDAGSPEEYERAKELLRPLPMPVYVIPGNHDDRTAMRTAFGVQGTQAMTGFIQYVVDDLDVRLIGLDTSVPGEAGGLLCAERLAWLDATLAAAPDRPTLIFLHHPPFLTGLRVMDAIGLAGADALGEIVARHPQVERLLSGHLHRAIQRRFHGTIAMTCPSTAHQTVLDLARPETLAMAMEPPGCLLHAWSADGGLVTHVSTIAPPGPVLMVYDGQSWAD